MAHIELNNPLPGILGLLEFRKELAAPLTAFTQALLRGPSPLSAAERELIAAHVSHQNQCNFCFKSHAAAAGALLGVGLGVLEEISNETSRRKVSPRLESLLAIASQVTRGGRSVSAEHVARARAAGASDVEVHDTVLIAAAFCMFNRYVDGLSTFAPEQNEAYLEMGKHLAEHGYVDVPERSATV
ncbi:MAG: carboxymuconolactone decarboxylase family protein [Polyangiaceae bacterium]